MLRKTLMAAAGLALGVASPAMAVTFIGTTEGCFGAACVPGAAASNEGLTFTGGSFNVSDLGGFAAIGGAPSTLGTFALSTLPSNFTGDTFTLKVNFSSPDSTPDSSNTSALLFGAVVATTGGVFIDFGDDNTLFTSPEGAFNLNVSDLNVTAGQSAPVTGNILVDNAVPEPGTWAMLLVGFGGVGFAMRRRKSANGTQRVRIAYS